ncbi:hypothetical protein CL3_34010 [butyrate-producing bacterium SM4/1]|nr:hypothetical protein CLS_38110 [[Clostridium] cf. saccharolyticum K10]CBL37069.1 hypothetical protein CL3_34010 [butyrate-producing bacterium SM4/1]
MNLNAVSDGLRLLPPERRRRAWLASEE